MAYDGHILCRKCRRVLYLGKHKEGQFWPVKTSLSQFAQGVLLFISDHFAHGELAVMGNDPFERFLETCTENEWPLSVFLEADDEGQVRLVEKDRLRRR
jgi:hypothetical protein